MTIDHSTFNRPVNGKPNIDISNGGYWQARLDSVYMEGNGPTDGVTEMVHIGTGSTGFTSVNTETNPGFGYTGTKPAYGNYSGYNWALIASITGGAPGAGVAMNDHNTSTVYLSAGERNVNQYISGGSGANYFSNIVVGSCTGCGGGGGGTVTTTGSPASGNLSKFTGATSISNADSDLRDVDDL